MIPRRLASAVVGAIAFLALLVGFRTPVEDAAGARAATQPSDTPGSATTEPTPTPDPGTPEATATPAPDGAAKTVDGPVVSTRFGNVQVSVTIEGGRITDVQAIQLPSRDRHSAQLSDYAAPILRSAALTAQSASIDIVSGATYTSSAYAESLQAALDEAGV